MKDNLRRPGTCGRLVGNTRLCRPHTGRVRECPVQYEQNCEDYEELVKEVKHGNKTEAP